MLEDIKFIPHNGEEEDEISLKARYEVCPRCEGRGSHVNPAIDGHGISAQEFAEDPEFEEDYFAGVYDVTCYECKGLRVVPEVDRTPGVNKEEDLKKYDEYLEWEDYYRREREAERRWGC